MTLTRKGELRIYLIIIALTALALGFSNDVFSNYFKDAYNVSPFQRGIIEFPREIPGFLCLLVVSVLAGFGDIKIAIVAQFLSMAGMLVLGLTTPIFSVMLIFLFTNSLGMHLFFPVQDSIGMALVKKENMGRRMGQFKGIFTAFQMVAAMVVFAGFKFQFFSFTTPVKSIFLIPAVIFAVVILLFFILEKSLHGNDFVHTKTRLKFRKEYKYYYILVILFGIQKQMMIVYGPWVLIELLGKRADTLALLTMAGSFVGIFFIPFLGRLMDRFGIKTMMYADALSFIGVYILYGLLSGGFADGYLALTGVPVLLAYILFVIDRMSTQMGMVRTVYLKSIAVTDTDITSTLSLGISMDHTVTIIAAFLGGLVWTKWGPQYIFYLAAAASLGNLWVAWRVPRS